MKKVLTLLLGYLVITASLQAQTINSMSPDTAYNNQVIDPVITASNLFFQTSSPSGDIYQIYIKQGGYTSYLFDVFTFWQYSINVVNDTAFIDNYTVPLNAPLGLYDLYVVNNWLYTYVLPNAFEILPPDGYAQGKAYNDLDSSGTYTVGEPGLANILFNINPGNYSVLSDSLGNFSAPLFNGTYTITRINDPNNYYYQTAPASGNYNFTISNNNSTGLDFGLRRKLISISPNYGFQYHTTSGYITSEGLFTSAPQQAYLRHKNGNTVFLTNLSVSSTDYLNFTAPFVSQYIGVYSLFVRMGSVWHQLPDCFTLLPPDGYISGSVFYDYNSNGIRDTNDVPIPNQDLLLTPPVIYSITNSLGQYNFGVLNGSYTVTYLANPNYIPTSPVNQSVVINNNNVNNINFGIVIPPSVDSINASMSSSLPRCFTQVGDYLQATNFSGHPIDGRLYFIKSSSVSFNSSIPLPDYNSNDTLYWNFYNIDPLKSFNVSVNLTMPGPGTIITRTIIVHSYDSLQNVITSDQESKTQTVVCSFDPNDKQVSPIGIGSQNYTLFSDELFYKIRFQNTGNDTAFNVFIYDTLDASLDFNTFKFVNSSHNATVELNKTNGAVKFSFKNIHLPDSNVDEPMSHGFIEYSIHCLSGLAANTIVDNTAHIVFDLNDAIVTNTVSNTMVYVIPLFVNSNEPELQNCFVFPNPVSDIVRIRFENLNDINNELKIFDNKGALVLEVEFHQSELIVPLTGLAQGHYSFIVVNRDGLKTGQGEFIKQ
ncbi:MAG TPA: hypothetical protein PKH65_09440 [Bacteroidia bacterium]|nr:hypothetical protein [Bacteroidia bacterium]